MAILNKLSLENKALVKMMEVINYGEVKELKKLLKEKAVTEIAITSMVERAKGFVAGSDSKTECWEWVIKFTEKAKLLNNEIDAWLLVAKMKVAEHILTELSGKETHVDILGNVSNEDSRISEMDWLEDGLEPEVDVDALLEKWKKERSEVNDEILDLL